MEARSRQSERFKVLYLDGYEKAKERLRQGGDVATEQRLMSYLGSQLEAARLRKNVAMSWLVENLPVTENFIFLAEKGLVDPEKIFKYVQPWGELLQVSIENETNFFERTYSRQLR